MAKTVMISWEEKAALGFRSDVHVRARGSAGSAMVRDWRFDSALSVYGTHALGEELEAIERVKLAESENAERLADKAETTTANESFGNLTPSPTHAKRVHRIAPASAARKPQRLRVAAYCRVSTCMDSQETSIEGQRAHFERVIAANPEWQLAGIYLEAGVTGTKAETRPELQRLLADCRAGCIDLIVTKSISRFARNTTDCLQLVRQLTDLGIHLSFEKEGIHTARMESELMLSILAALAEEESRSISDNMKWGVRKRFQAGTYRGGKVPFGYMRQGCDLRVNPEEARIVREIFAQAIAGTGPTAIARDLNAQGLQTRAGNAWCASTIRKMLRNPVYMGDTFYQRTYVDERYRQRPNNGELDRYYERGHHEAIVSREEFALASGICDPLHLAVDVPFDVARTMDGRALCVSASLGGALPASIPYAPATDGSEVRNAAAVVHAAPMGCAPHGRPHTASHAPQEAGAR